MSCSTSVPLPIISASSKHYFTEPIQVNKFHLSKEERQRRLQNHLCPTGHLYISCSLIFSKKGIKTMALIVSDAVGNVMDETFSHLKQVPIVSCLPLLQVTAVDVGSRLIQRKTPALDLTVCITHSEKNPNSPFHQIIPSFWLYSWLWQHYPVISLSESQITHWSAYCHYTSLQLIHPVLFPVAQITVQSTQSLC